MPSTIPYDPSLVLGNIVHKDALANLKQISDRQAPIDQKEDTMNSLISLKRSIDMTIQELVDMEIDPSDLRKTSTSVGSDIQKAAIDYANEKVKGLQDIQKLKAVPMIHVNAESPIDYNKTQIKTMPLSADSLKMNAQYFSFDENSQTSETMAAQIGGFVSETVDWLGDEVSSQASSSASSQVNSQYSRHSISGTLVISISCTHKNALLLAPLIIDVDKAIRAWNQLYPQDLIDIDSNNVKQAMAAIAAKPGNPDTDPNITILSGATYGSCFIGMVHIKNTTTTQSSEVMVSMAASLQEQFKVGGWFADVSGGFGVESSFSNDAKNLLSSQAITSHCTLTTVGSIPSIKSNSVKMAVQQFATFDGAESMKQLAALQNATAGDKDSIDASAAAARTGQQMVALKNAQVKGVLEGLGTIDDQANKILDINSMMDAMDDYIQKALAGNLGVPINYYLKFITKAQLAEMWVAKYFPNKFLSISGDDSGSTGNGGSGTGGGR